MRKLIITLVVVCLIGLSLGALFTRAAAADKDTIEVIPLGSPIVVVIKDGKPTPTGVMSITLLLRSDGVVGWELSEEAQEKFSKEAEKGPKIPHQYGGKRK